MANNAPQPPAEGQAPNADGTPQAGNSPTAPQAGNGQQSSLTLDEALNELKKVRAEAASHRVKLKEFEDAQRAADEAKLGDLEKAKKQADEATRKLEAQAAKTKALAVKVAVQSLASKLNIADADAAIGLLQSSGIAVDFNKDTDEPENIEAALKQLIQRFPILTAKAEPPARPNSGGPMNPPKSGATAANAPLTRASIAAMSMKERMERLPEIREFLANEAKQ